MAITYKYQVTSVFDNGEESYPGLSGVSVGPCTALSSSPIVLTSADHGLSDGDVVQAFDFTEMVELNNRQFVVDNSTEDTFQLAGEDATDRSPEITGGNFRKAFISAVREDLLDLQNNHITINWDAVIGASDYVVYKLEAGAYRFMAQTTLTLFEDDGLTTPNPDKLAPQLVDTSLKGNPSACGYYEQRRILGGTSEAPDTWHASKIGSQDIFSTSGSVKADGPIKATLAAENINKIEHFVPGRDLIVLTSGQEWQVSSDGGFSADTIGQKPQSSVGSSPVRPLRTNSSIIFERVNGGALHEIQYSFERDGYANRELSLLSRHLFKRVKIKDIAQMLTPENLVFTTLDNGDMNVLSYYPDQEVLAWCRWETDGDFESVAAVQNTETGEDDIYLVVNREIGGVPVRYIELLDQRNFREVPDCFFVDSGLSYSGIPVSSVSGLEHLAGREVSVLADGGVVYGKTVSAGGEVTLPHDASKVHIGLPYKSVVKTLNPDDTRKTTHGRRKKINDIAVQLYQTDGLRIGRNEDEALPLKQNIDLEDGELFTGAENINVSGDWDTDASVYVEQSDPLPMTILAITPDIEVGDV